MEQAWTVKARFRLSYKESKDMTKRSILEGVGDIWGDIPRVDAMLSFGTIEGVGGA